MLRQFWKRFSKSRDGGGKIRFRRNQHHDGAQNLSAYCPSAPVLAASIRTLNLEAHRQLMLLAGQAEEELRYRAAASMLAVKREQQPPPNRILGEDASGEETSEGSISEAGPTDKSSGQSSFPKMYPQPVSQNSSKIQAQQRRILLSYERLIALVRRAAALELNVYDHMDTISAESDFPAVSNRESNRAAAGGLFQLLLSRGIRPEVFKPAPVRGGYAETAENQSAVCSENTDFAAWLASAQTRLLSYLLLSAILGDFYLLLSGFYPSEEQARLLPALRAESRDEVQEQIQEYLSLAAKESAEIGYRMSLWGRRITAEALLAVRENLPAAKNCPAWESLVSSLVADHSRRMSALGLVP